MHRIFFSFRKAAGKSGILGSNNPPKKREILMELIHYLMTWMIHALKC